MYPHTHHQPNKPILDVQHITVRYNGGAALDDITFHLHEGERIAVVGPNGAGKTTTVKMLAPVAKYARGKFSTDLRVNGGLGQDMMPLFQQLTGKGNIQTSQVAIKDFPALEKLAAATASRSWSLAALMEPRSAAATTTRSVVRSIGSFMRPNPGAFSRGGSCAARLAGAPGTAPCRPGCRAH